MKYKNKELSHNINILLIYMKRISEIKSNSKSNWIESVPLSFSDIKNIVFEGKLSDGKLKYLLKITKKNQKIEVKRFFRYNDSNLTTAKWIITKWGYQSV